MNPRDYGAYDGYDDHGPEVGVKQQPSPNLSREHLGRQLTEKVTITVDGGAPPPTPQPIEEDPAIAATITDALLEASKRDGDAAS